MSQQHNWRILFSRNTLPDSVIVEACSRREARDVFLREHPDIPSRNIRRVVLVPE